MIWDNFLKYYFKPTISNKTLCDIPELRSISRPTLSEVLFSIADEVKKAELKWPPMNSAHEAYSVMAEEVDELWEHVKVKQGERDNAAMRKEAIQVAAMAVRFIRDVCDKQGGQK
jgi:hypothetical protein